MRREVLEGQNIQSRKELWSVPPIRRQCAAGNVSEGHLRQHLAAGGAKVAEREIVERVFKQLPQKYAICLWLYENDGLSCAEIAEVLNISASAVKMRLMRARERFIGLYHKEVGEE